MSNWFTWKSLVFSAKSFAAAMLALYLALRLGLPRPFWSLVTAYVVSQPFAGATTSKAVYRTAGTLGGAIIAACLIPPIAGSPFLATILFSVWLGICLYISMLDRTPRAYTIILMGYTVPIIALPTMSDISLFGASTLFETALARMEEILLGISCSAVIHSLFIPQGIDQAILDKLDHAMMTTQKTINSILSSQKTKQQDESATLSLLSQTVTEMRLLATHLPFDTSNLTWLTWLVQELQNRSAAMIPILASIRNRLARLRQQPGKPLSHNWENLLATISEWSANGRNNFPAVGIQLRSQIDSLLPSANSSFSEYNGSLFNLGMELHHLINESERCFYLRKQIDAGRSGQPPDMRHKPLRKTPVALFVDRRTAFISAIAAALAQGISCLLWFYSGWPTGVSAPVMAGIYCMFFATMDNPIPVLKMQCLYIGLSTVTAGMYLLWLLPSSHSFEMLMMVYAPFLLILSALTANPATSGRSTPFMMLTICSMTMFDMGVADMTTFINTEISQTLGVALAILFTSLFRVVNAASVSRTVAGMIWTELSKLGITTKIPSVMAVSVRIIDGISLIAPRLAQLENSPSNEKTGSLSAMHLLTDLCIGLNMARLLRLEKRLLRTGILVRPFLHALSESFAYRHKDRDFPFPELLEQLETLIFKTAVSLPENTLKRQVLAVLSGIRCDISSLQSNH